MGTQNKRSIHINFGLEDAAVHLIIELRRTRYPYGGFGEGLDSADLRVGQHTVEQQQLGGQVHPLNLRTGETVDDMK